MTDFKYINIREILSRLLRHPLLQDVNLEQVIQYTIDFIGIFGLPKMYLDKEDTLTVKDYRAQLPEDFISIIQVKDKNSDVCLRSMTESFSPKNHEKYHIEFSFRSDVETRTTEEGEYQDKVFPPYETQEEFPYGVKDFVVSKKSIPLDATYKLQGSVLFTSFKEGEIVVSYKAIPVDGEGLPLLIDNPVFLRALESYIKKEVFTILFDVGKISPAVLQNTQQHYAWAAGQLQSEFTIPSISEMESIRKDWCTLLQRTNRFKNSFKMYE